MPDDETDEQWSGQATDPEDPSVAHDDIMKRLLDYQRSLRGDEELAEFPEVATTTEVAEVTPEAEEEAATDAALAAPVVDVAVTEPDAVATTEAEPESAVGAEPEPSFDFAPDPEPSLAAEPAPAAPDPLAGSRAELEARVQRLEERLERLGAKVVALRTSFQDMAISADERLAAMKEEIDEDRSDPNDG